MTDYNFPDFLTRPVRSLAQASKNDVLKASPNTASLKENTDFQKALHAIHPKLTAKISPRAKRIALRLSPSKREMVLVIPKRYKNTRALKFAEQHQSWIEEKLAELPDAIPFLHGTELPLFGKKHIINIQHAAQKRFTDIKLAEGFLDVQTNLEDPQSRINRFLKQEALRVLEEKTHQKAAQINKSVKSVSVRDTSSRWGSCGPDGKISYSWRLIFAPPNALDYVVAHEVAHLQHMDHSAKFWNVCAELCVDYEGGKSWIRSNGHELIQYGQRE